MRVWAGRDDAAHTWRGSCSGTPTTAWHHRMSLRALGRTTPAGMWTMRFESQGPASSRCTVFAPFADSRLVSTQPADPAPVVGGAWGTRYHFGCRAKRGSETKRARARESERERTVVMNNIRALTDDHVVSLRLVHTARWDQALKQTERICRHCYQLLRTWDVRGGSPVGCEGSVAGQQAR